MKKFSTAIVENRTKIQRINVWVMLLSTIFLLFCNSFVVLLFGVDSLYYNPLPFILVEIFIGLIPAVSTVLYISLYYQERISKGMATMSSAKKAMTVYSVVFSIITVFVIIVSVKIGDFSDYVGLLIMASTILSFILYALIIAISSIIITIYLYRKKDPDGKPFPWKIVGAVVIIAVVIISFVISPLLGDSSGGKGKCKICGDDVYAGSYCEDHFNDWADWQDKQNNK